MHRAPGSETVGEHDLAALGLCGRTRSRGFGTLWERPDQETQGKGRYVGAGGGGNIYIYIYIYM